MSKQILYKILHYLSKGASYLLVFCSLFIVQKFLYDLIPFIEGATLFNILYVSEFLAGLIAYLIIDNFIEISSPYADKIKDKE